MNIEKNHWIRNSFIEWLVGLGIGIVTTFFVMLMIFYIPDIENFGIDSGYRVRTWLKKLSLSPEDAFQPQLIKINDKEIIEPSYIFLDIDSGGNDPATEDWTSKACAALEEKIKNSPYMQIDNRCKDYISNDDCIRSTIKKSEQLKNNNLSQQQKDTRGVQKLHCAATRPLNRYVIAEALKKLSYFKPKLVAIDIVLAPDPVTVDEDKYLKDAMGKWAEVMGNKIIFAANASISPHSKDYNVVLPSDPTYGFMGEAGVAQSENETDSTIRRYRKCFEQISGGAYITTPVKSLPFLIAKKVDIKLECEDRKESVSRIYFTFPSLHETEISPENPDNKESKRKVEFYKPIYKHCLVENLWNSDSPCSLEDTYKNAIVVIGTSNPFRRDLHYTPLGDMSGTEVVINAVRSFILTSNEEAASHEGQFPWHKWGVELFITAVCSLVWLFYHILTNFFEQKPKENLVITHMKYVIVKGVLFVSTFVSVILIAVMLVFYKEKSSPNLDVLLPVFCLGLEQYAEIVHKIVFWLELRINNFFTYLTNTSFWRRLCSTIKVIFQLLLGS